MKIGFFELEGWEEAAIRSAFPADDLFLTAERIDAAHPPARTDLEVLCVFVDSRLDRDMLARFPDLKHVATRSTGFDHIDTAACQERGIGVSYVPSYGDHTVAEYAFGLMLTLTRKLYPAIHRVKATGSFSLESLRGVELFGKTLGVVGTGRIGRNVVMIAKSFGMKVAAFDPFPDLLSRADILSFHCPYTKDTHHLLNQGNIGLMKKGAFLVNTARGPIIETEALVGALQSGALAGAALDVIEEEGDMKDELSILRAHPKEEELKAVLVNHLLMKMPNVVMTPHLAFDSAEALDRILNTSLGNVKAYAAGAPTNLIPAHG